ncbi:MAG: arsenate reductase ArsC [Pseudomonadota bacterium]
MFHILALCAGNASRSILAEAILNRDGQGRVKAWSAGANPKGVITPQVRDVLERRGAGHDAMRSKSWNEFAAQGAPDLDLVLNLCPTVSGATQPDWPGQPISVHWHLDDPSAAPPGQVDLACQQAYHGLSIRVNAFLSLPFERLSRSVLTARLADIGES